MQDRAHLPASVTPLLQEIYPRGFAAGFSAALNPYGVLLDTMQLAFVNGFPYTQPVPFDVPGPDGPKSPEQLGAEIGRRTALADAAFANRIWRDTLKHWDEEAKPRSIARHRELAAVDLPSLSDEELQAHLHQCMDHMSQMWQQHHTYNGAALVAVGDFVLHAAGWTQRDPVPIFAVFDGWSPVSGVLNPEIAPAIEALRADPAAEALLTGDAPAAERLAQASCSKCQPSTRTSAPSGFASRRGSISRTRRSSSDPTSCSGAWPPRSATTPITRPSAPTRSPPSFVRRCPRISGPPSTTCSAKRASCTGCATSAVCTATRPRSA